MSLYIQILILKYNSCANNLIDYIVNKLHIEKYKNGF